MSLVLLVIFIVLMLLGLPVAVSLGFATIATLLFMTQEPMSLVIQSMFSSMNSFIMVAVPLFILAGVLMDEGGVAQRIFDFPKSVVGWLPGGMGHVSIVANVIFAGMSGSSVAEVASIGNISIKAMERDKYPLTYATSLSLITSMLATIIPPSILMIIAASVANVSIGKALFAGIIPGILIAVIFMVVNYLYCKKKNIGHRIPFSITDLVRKFVPSLPALLAPVILLGGILSGFFTSTEAAAVAVVYTLIVALLVYRHIDLKRLPSIFYRTAKMTGTILFIAVTAKPAGWIFSFDGLPSTIASGISGISHNPTVILLLLFVFLILVGMFMDATAAIFILVPILLPAVTTVGIDPVFFVVFTVIVLSLGLITPPVGVCLYAVCNVTGLSLEKVVKSSWGWMAITCVVLLVFALFPGLIMGPVSWMGI